jgi:vitamin K-dependent gamma-carboxylase
MTPPRTLAAALRAPVSIAPLVYIRMLFGAVMLWEVWRYFDHRWIARYFIEPEHLFPYYGFDWVRPWPGDGMYVHFALLGLLALCVATGTLYRVTAPLFFLGFTYVFLLDQSRYLNHFYLVVLVSLVLAFLPAHRAFSVDARLRPAIRRQSIPAWMLWLLRAQIGIPYLFGGIAKLSGDWLRGEPMRMWLSERTDFPVIGGLFTNEVFVYLFAWGGLLLDLLAVPMLLWRRTRWLAVGILAAFHLLNAELFTIGIFPWLMLAATVIFFPPASVERAMARVGIRMPHEAGTVRHGTAGLAIAAAFVVIQILVPLRHLMYRGDVNWTEEGHRFSWHMKLRDKEGSVRLTVTSGDSSWTVRPRSYMAPHQSAKLTDSPDMILQLAHLVADDYRRRGHRDVNVFGRARVSLNGRMPQEMIDTSVDLAAVDRGAAHSTWIVPLGVPLGERATSY